jgi:hypothetical protein
MPNEKEDVVGGCFAVFVMAVVAMVAFKACQTNQIAGDLSFRRTSEDLSTFESQGTLTLPRHLIVWKGGNLPVEEVALDVIDEFNGSSILMTYELGTIEPGGNAPAEETKLSLPPTQRTREVLLGLRLRWKGQPRSFTSDYILRAKRTSQLVATNTKFFQRSGNWGYLAAVAVAGLIGSLCFATLASLLTNSKCSMWLLTTSGALGFVSGVTLIFISRTLTMLLAAVHSSLLALVCLSASVVIAYVLVTACRFYQAKMLPSQGQGLILAMLGVALGWSCFLVWREVDHRLASLPTPVEVGPNLPPGTRIERATVVD